MSLTQPQIDARLGRLFSTDVAAALGADRTKTPIQLYLEKRGEIEPQQQPDYEGPARFGLHFQHAIAKLYTEKTGIPLVPEPRTLYHPQLPWMGSHFDYRAAGHWDVKRLVEIKFFHPARRKEFGDTGSSDMPTKPLLQCLHEMAVADADVIDLAVLFGNSEFCIFTLTRDLDSEEALILREKEFMTCLQMETLPEPMTLEDLKRIYPKDSGRVVLADADLYRDIATFSKVVEMRKQAEKEEARLKESIARKVGDAGIVNYNGQTILTYKSDNQGKPIRRMVEGSVERLRSEYPAVFLELSEEVAPSRRFLCKL